MTLGQDQHWRRQVLSMCNLPSHGRLLDVGAGTGDLGYEAMLRYPTVQAIAADFTYEMMAYGRFKVAGIDLPFVQADTLHLPFPDHYFDAVCSGFMVRNVVDRIGAFREMARVTKPGGRVVCLETTPPADGFIAEGSKLYFNNVVPLLGAIISGDREAYTYLPQSTMDFIEAGELARLMEQAGLKNVVYQKLMFGTVAIHIGTA
jgi:demethylmenaquinone methyltransferase/2-methoxy-6-polyprenyl-1,4-benzoquinol methylase